MYNSKYFWTDNKKYENITIEPIMKTCKPDEQPPESMHPTFKLQDFLPEFFNFNKQKVVNLSKNSLLSKKILTKSIQEVIDEI